MKTILILVSILALFACNDKIETPNNSQKIIQATPIRYSVYIDDYKVNNTHYRIFNSSNGSVFVINVTLDSLQINKLKWSD